jgi:WD40 repeat protein
LKFYGRDMVSTRSARRKTEPAKLSRLMRGELDWIVMRCLEKDRNRRYETANGFAADVQRYLADEAVEACPPSARYRLRKFARRHKRILATVGLVAFALVMGTVVSAWQAIRASDAEGLAQTRLQAETEARNATREQLHLTQQAEDKATQRLYRSLVAQTTASRVSRRIGQRFETLKTLAEATKMARDLNLPAKDFLNLRNEAIACLALPDLRVAKEWNGWPAGSFSVQFDSALERYARVDRQGSVSVRRVADDAEVCHLSGLGPGESWPLFSPDGQCLGLSHDSRFQLWKVAGKEPVKVFEWPTAPFAFSPDGRQCARALPDDSLCLYDLPSGRQTKQLGAGLKPRYLAFHPTDAQLAVSGATGVQVRDLATGDVVADLAQPGGSYSVAWHPDGRTLAALGADRIIHIWDVATRKPTTRLEGYKGDGIVFAYDHAGDMLVSTSWAGELHLWDPRTGRQLFSTQAPTGCLNFSADDRFLAAEVVPPNGLRIWEVAKPSAFRTLVGSRGPVLGLVPHFGGCAVSPNGRLLAIATEAGVSFRDLAQCKELAFAPVGDTRSVVFESSNALLTGGATGLFHWPVRENVGVPGLLRIGPPTRLLPFWGEEFACSSDRRVITTPQGSGGLVLDRDHPDQPIPLTPHTDVRYAAVSPDGRWAATGSHWDTKVKVWAARTGKLERVLPVESGSRVGFSPDGKWLATNGGGLRLWAVGSWQEGPVIGGEAFAYSLDGKLLAVDTTFGAVRLVDPDTGREYARLEDPHERRAHQLTFSPDGTQLAAIINDSDSIHVWDLRLIREQLVTMGLDWDLPPYPPAEPDDGQPLRVEVDPGELGVFGEARELRHQGFAYARSSQWDKAVGAYAKAVELDPKDAATVNDLAWLLATCPDAKFRDPGRSLELAQKIVRLTPWQGNAWNTLGVAHYRAGDWKAAVAALEKSMELRKGGDGADWFVLAMAHWQLSDKKDARTWYDRAVRWMEKNQPKNEELGRFRMEAEELLKIEKEAGPK